MTFTLGTSTGATALGSPSVNTLTITEPAAVQFVTGSETESAGLGAFSIPVTLSGTPDGTPTVSTFASGFNSPFGLAVDAAGNLYVADTGDGTVDKVTPAGIVSTFVSGFDDPIGLAVNAFGDLFVATAGLGEVFEVTPAGMVSPFASGFDDPVALAFDPAGNLYVANLSSSTVSEVTPSGQESTFATGLDLPDGLAFGDAGNLYVSNAGNNTVSEVTPAGTVSTFASGFNDPGGLAFDDAGNVYVADGGDDTVSEVTPAGAVFTLASGFDDPVNLAFGGGSLYVVNSRNDLSRVTDTVTVPFSLGGTAASGVDYSGVSASPLTFAIGQHTQDITGTLLSDPGPNRTLTFTLGTPTGGAVLGSPSENTLTITQQAVVKFSTGSEIVGFPGTFIITVTVVGTPEGAPTVFPYASGFNDPDGLAVDAAGDLYVADAGNGTVREVTAAGTVIIFSGFNVPAGMTFDSAGNLFVADSGDDEVREITPAGTVSIFATGFDDPTALAFDSAGNLYVANRGNGTVSVVTPAGKVSPFVFGFDGASGLAFDAGNLYVADSGDGKVSKVTPAGQVSTYASGFNAPDGLAFDAAGNLYVANAGDRHGERGDACGVVSTFAAGLDDPTGLAFDSTGNLYVANEGNNTVSEVAEGLSVPFTLGGSGIGAVAGVTASPLLFRIGQTTEDITGTLVNPEIGGPLTLTLTLGTPTGGAVLGSPSVNNLTIIEPPVLTCTNHSDANAGDYGVPWRAAGLFRSRRSVKSWSGLNFYSTVRSMPLMPSRPAIIM